jgi:hypothetical protein
MGPWTEQPRSRPSPAKALKAGGLALRKIADALAAAIVACSSGTSTKTAALPPGEHETDARRLRVRSARKGARVDRSRPCVATCADLCTSCRGFPAQTKNGQRPCCSIWPRLITSSWTTMIDPILSARAALVRRYRTNPNLYPDGIGAWYHPEEWTDDGRFVGSGTPPGGGEPVKAKVTKPDVTKIAGGGRLKATS